MRVAPATEPDAPATRIEAARHHVARHPLVAGVASGVVLWTSFPPLEWHPAAWVALAPLFWLVTVREARLKAYLAAWLGGLAFWLLALEWLRMIDVGGWTGWVLMALFFSCWWPLFLAVARLAVFRLRLPLMMAAPIVWVGLEYGRAYFLSGFPWYYLAHSQFRNLYLIQIADFASSLGISLLIALVNALAVDLMMLPLLGRSRRGVRVHPRQYVRLCLVTCLIGATLCYGAIRVSTARFHDGPRLALLQSNIEQKHKNKGDAVPIVREFLELVDRAVARRERPDLIVWPETAYPYGFISVDDAIEPETLEKQVRTIGPKWTGKEWRERMESILTDLHSWTDKVKVPMLVGTTFYDHQKNSFDRYNSAVLFLPNLRAIHFYHKMHLVPFGEYFPLIETLPWLAALTPYAGQKAPDPELRAKADHPAPGPVSPRRQHLLRRHDSSLDPRIIRRS